MPKKNGNNEGNIRRRRDGLWEGRYTLGFNAEGKQIQRSIYGKTRAEVAQKLGGILATLNAGTYIQPNKMTVSEWLSVWYEQYAKAHVRPSTLNNYDTYIHKHIAPTLGGVKLAELNTDRLQFFFNEKAGAGRIDGKGGLSPKTIRNLYNMFHEALEQARKNGLIGNNVIEAVVLPHNEKREMRVLSREEQRRVMETLDTERLGFAIVLDLSTGMRIGELCGLKWHDIDFVSKSLQVRRTLQRIQCTTAEREQGSPKTRIHEGKVKTDSGFRAIPIQEKIFERLLHYKEQQDKEKALAGSAYEDRDYVFASPTGRWIEPSTMRDVFNRILNRAGVSHANFHAIRHTFATRAIEAGVPIKAVSEILGHATVQITMDLYCHSSMELKRSAVDRMQELW